MNVRYPAQDFSLFCKHKLMGGNCAHHRRGTVDYSLSWEKISNCQVRLVALSSLTVMMSLTS